MTLQKIIIRKVNCVRQQPIYLKSCDEKLNERKK